MKKLISVFAVLVFLSAGAAFAGELKVGAKASDWSYKDSDDKVFTMESWAGKVLLVTYVDPDESDLNEHFTDAMKKAKDDGLLKEETYKGMGIADCAATWKPDALIRIIAGRKAKKYNTTILFDYDASLRNAWGLGKDTSNVILLDKNRVCRYIFRGRVPDDQVASTVKLAEDLQKE
ncbi:MAG: YtfJ family protein [Proteobacteria bacterium]|nr:YtfJ family protein [Pseudomonadota bacterium]MBU1713650.1 YtfJ family protein [Pseudomonadota bacterium]